MDLWQSLQQYYASTSSARLTAVKRQLQTAQKGDASCSQYLHHLRRVADELAFIGAPIPDDELVTSTINGLGVDYNPIVATVTAARRHNSFSFSNLHSLLLSHEALLKRQATAPAAFYAGRGRGNRFRPPTPTQNRPVNSQPPRPNAPYNASAPHATQTTPGVKPTCQICQKFGHGAKLCYRRYDQDPYWVPNPRLQAYNVQASAPSTRTSSTDWVIDSGQTTTSPMISTTSPLSLPIVVLTISKSIMVLASLFFMLVIPLYNSLTTLFSFAMYSMYQISLLT